MCDSDVLGAATKIRRLAQHCEDPLAQVQALALNNRHLQNETIPTELWQRFKNLAILELQSNGEVFPLFVHAACSNVVQLSAVPHPAMLSAFQGMHLHSPFMCRSQ